MLSLNAWVTACAPSSFNPQLLMLARKHEVSIADALSIATDLIDCRWGVLAMALQIVVAPMGPSRLSLRLKRRRVSLLGSPRHAALLDGSNRKVVGHDAGDVWSNTCIAANVLKANMQANH